MGRSAAPAHPRSGPARARRQLHPQIRAHLPRGLRNGGWSSSWRSLLPAKYVCGGHCNRCCVDCLPTGGNPMRRLAQLILMTLLLTGCGSSTDERLLQQAKEHAAQQAETHRQMARQQQEVAEGSRRLIEADAKARQEMASMQNGLREDQADDWPAARPTGVRAAGDCLTAISRSTRRRSHCQRRAGACCPSAAAGLRLRPVVRCSDT